VSEYSVHIGWQRETPDFSYDAYDRTHWWEFGSGSRIQASSAPEFHGNAALVNPEEALAAALASCHMLTFLAVAARRRLTVDRYEDDATATMGKNSMGREAVTRIVLRPRVTFGKKRPDPTELRKLHEIAHAQCFIANSVLTEVVIEPR
jgi:organic hydroperoxide reductase OsmC/OhrA